MIAVEKQAPQTRPPGLQGDRLVAARAVRGWTQTELAYHAEMNSTEVSRFERGIRQPVAPALSRLATALGCSSDYLLGLCDSPERNP